MPLLAIYGRIQRQPFLRNASILFGGMLGAQAASILLSPALTRLYTPQEFGVLGIYGALLAILVAMASLRYELAIPLVKTSEEATNLVLVCCIVLAVMTLVVGAVALALPVQLWQTLGLAQLFELRLLIPIGFAMMGLYGIVSYFATRDQAFSALARTQIAQGLVGPFSQIGFGLLDFGAPGLVFGFVLSRSVGMIGLGRLALQGHRLAGGLISVSRMVNVAKRYRRFPLIASWSALIDVAGTQALYILVSLSYAPRVVGYIMISERLLARPLTLLANAILQVFVGEVSKVLHTDIGHFRSRFRQVVWRQFAISVAWILVVNAAATWLFVPVFGADWADGLIFLRVASIGFAAQAVTQSVVHTLQILERQATAAAWQIGRLALVVGAFFLATSIGLEPPTAVFCYSLAQALACAVLVGLMAWSIEQRMNKIDRGRTTTP